MLTNAYIVMFTSESRTGLKGNQCGQKHPKDWTSATPDLKTVHISLRR